MNWIDILLLIVIGISVLSGFAAGFARVGIGFIAAVLGIFFGFWFYGIAAEHVLDYVSSKSVANLIGFFVIFFGIVIAGAIVGRILAKFFKWAGLSWFDRTLGGAFGLLRGIVMTVAIVTVLLAFAPSPPPKSVVESKFLPYVVDASNILALLTPHEIKEAFRDAKDNVQKKWAEHVQREPGSARKE